MGQQVPKNFSYIGDVGPTVDQPAGSARSVNTLKSNAPCVEISGTCRCKHTMAGQHVTWPAQAQQHLAVLRKEYLIDTT